MTDTYTFPLVSNDVISDAIEKSLEALRDPDTPRRVAEFYNPETNFAGATFADLEPREPNSVTATDLLAVTTMAVEIPAHAIRQFLQDRAKALEISERLRALPNKKLEDTTETDFAVMGDFYDLVKTSLSRAGVKFSNPWVTTSKLTARKRPGLFPVRDSVVCSYLGISKLRDYAKDWYVYRALMSDPTVASELAALVGRIEEADTLSKAAVDAEPLRLLDAALWRFAPR